MLPQVYLPDNDPAWSWCLVVGKYSGGVDFIPYTKYRKLELVQWPQKSFARRYKVESDMPIAEALALMNKAVSIVGADDDVLEALASFSTSNTITAMAKAPAKAVEAKAPIPTKGKPSRLRQEELPDVTVKKVREPKEQKEPRVSAASRFKELIMEGKLTDDAIFEIVQKEFNLDDSKRSYVPWYRNYLKKEGQNPPAAIIGKQNDELPAKGKKATVTTKAAPAVKRKNPLR